MRPDVDEEYPCSGEGVVTSGYVTTKGWEETEDGVDKNLAVHYYARWKFIGDLMPALKRAKEAGKDAKVLSVLATAEGTVIGIWLEKTFSIRKVEKQVLMYNDLRMEVKFPFFVIRHRTHFWMHITNRNMLPEI